ncbi:MAG: aminotransferase class V-fold PLP-dependent enzyme [Rhodobacteraceae bacterium]|nr:aminotransferase class V-fold PLP-dependent enzyme [Paracoccaceae bacterium]
MLSISEVAALTEAMQAAVVYRERISENGIAAADDYDTALQRFGGELPEKGTPPDQVIRELTENALPGLLKMGHPRFLGWVTGASDPTGIAADWLTSAWGQNAPFSSTTPAAAAAEESAGEWIKSLLGLPAQAAFGFTTGGTMANTIGLAAARNALLDREGWDVEAKGLFGAPEVTVILGEQAHSTVFLALRLIGFGADRALRVKANKYGQMDMAALEEVLQPLSGPVLIVAQAGHINSGAFDPLDEICRLAKTKKAWVHVDGAFGLWARACKETAHLAVGAESCDSWAVDGHKWLQTPYDSGFVFVRDEVALSRSMSVTASYLPEKTHREPVTTTPELSRRARGFAVWAVLRALGREGVSEMIGRHCAMAKRCAEGFGAIKGLRVLNRVELNQVALCCETGAGLVEDNELTARLLAKLQQSGVCYPSGAVWQGRGIIRMSFSSGKAVLEDAETIIDAVRSEWQMLGDENE